MKKLIVIALLLYGGYHYFSTLPAVGSFDEAGNPLTILFTIDNCVPCDNARQYLLKRKLKFQEVNISKKGDEALDKLRKSGGGRSFPYLITGDLNAKIFDKHSYTGMFAEVFGADFLTPNERMLLKKNFDSFGQAKLVMYSTKTCGYCAKAREFFAAENIPFTELFIDQDLNAKRHYQLLEGRGTPLIYIGYRRINGFNRALLESTIKSKLTL